MSTAGRHRGTTPRLPRLPMAGMVTVEAGRLMVELLEAREDTADMEGTAVLEVLEDTDMEALVLMPLPQRRAMVARPLPADTVVMEEPMEVG